jgi:putative hydrolase of HD superfamily
MQKLGQIHIDDMIRFSRLILQFQDVIRVVDLPRGTGRENDVEHSYHLAMMAWYLNSAGGFGYNVDKVIRYALVHDLAEAYAGDVHAFDAAARQGKVQREAEAMSRIKQEFPLGKDITDAVHDYELRIDDEARFVYALDKLMPILMIYLEGGKTWRADGLSLSQIHDNKQDKVAQSEPVNDLYLQLKALLDDQPHLFEFK